jgi:GTP-binding protein Era
MKKSGFIAMIGRPNSGKSTLLNRVLKSEVSIVTPKAQTTRERVLGILTEDKGQIVFVDTPGVHHAKEGGFNAYMVAEARQAIEDVACIWYLLDPNSWPGLKKPDGLKHEQLILEMLKGASFPVFVLINKVDIEKRDPEGLRCLEEQIAAALTARGVTCEGVFRISAKTGEGLKRLLEATWKLLPEGEPYYPDPDVLSDKPMRFFVAEKVREQLYLQLGEELPYSCAVRIEKYDEASKPPRIEATIFVERDSQKGIVIGKGAAKLKAIGQAARGKIEEFVGGKIFLGLKVEVLKNWTRDPESLKRLGYFLAEKPGKRKHR